MQFADDVKLLGVTYDSTMSFDYHIVDITRSCHYHINTLCHIRPLLTLDTAKAMAVFTAGSRLDYCNSVQYGMTQVNIDKLQFVQNVLARVVIQALGLVGLIASHALFEVHCPAGQCMANRACEAIKPFCL